MESSSQVLTDATGKSRSHLMPHLMIFYPGMRNNSMGMVGSRSMDVPGVAQEGALLSALIVVTRDWVDATKNQ